MKPSNLKLFLALTIAILAVSTSAIWVRLAMETTQTYTVGFSLFLAASRLLISAVILLPTIRRIKFQEVNRQAIFWAILAGICLAGHFASWISSLAFTSIVASTTLVTTNPIWVALLSRFFFKERLSGQTICGILIAFSGGILIAVGNSNDFNPGSNPLGGNILALIGSVMASLYIMTGTQAQKLGLSLGNYIIIAYATAAIALCPIPILFGVSYRGYPAVVYLYVLSMAVIAQLIGHTTFNWALRWLSPTFIALSILWEPVISSLLAAVIFQEIPSLTLLWGGLTLLLGIAIAILGKSDRA